METVQDLAMIHASLLGRAESHLQRIRIGTTDGMTAQEFAAWAERDLAEYEQSLRAACVPA